MILPRLQAAGADTDKIAFGPHLDLTEEIDTLLEQANAMPDLKLIVLSPISDFFGSGITSEPGMRSRLRPLMQWAARQAVAVVGITHPSDKKDQFAGSKVYRKAARAAWVAIVDPNDDEPIIKQKRRLLVANKANNAPDTARLAYRIEGVTLPDGINTSRVIFSAPPTDTSEDKPRKTKSISCKSNTDVTAPRMPRVRTSPKTTEAMHWLNETLSNGSMNGTAIKSAAKDAGISKGILYKAAAAIGVVIEDAASVKEPKLWRLP